MLKNLMIATILTTLATPAFAAPNISIGCFGTNGCQKYEMSITNNTNTETDIEVYCPRMNDPNGKLQKVTSFDIDPHTTECVDARQNCYYSDDYKYNITLTLRSEDHPNWRKVRTCKGRW